MSERKSEFLLICIPPVEGGGEIIVQEFESADACQEAFFEERAKGYWTDVLGIYRHHGRGPLDNRWWGGAWTGYAARNAATPA